MMSQSDITLFEYFVKTYRQNDKNEFLEEENKKNPFCSYKDFALALAQYEELGEDNMTVGKSSTWAVCQEFLGNLKGTDLLYTKSRGGIWNCGYDPITRTSYIIGVRDILSDLKSKYP